MFTQIHETLLEALDIYAFATPESEVADAYRPYIPYENAQARTTLRGVAEPPCPYTLCLVEPSFFPAGSEYHGLVSVDHDVPSTIPKQAAATPGRRAARPAVFFLEPLEGDVSESGNATLTVVVHNLAIWEPADESEPARLRRGHVAITLNGQELTRCGRRTCSVAVHGLPDGPIWARATLFGPPSAASGGAGRLVGDTADVHFFVCARGVRECSSGECRCVTADNGHGGWEFG
jgi:hypothetical protein